MPDPYEHFPADAIAAAAECPLENVAAHWPKLVEQMGHAGINERLVQIGMIGTVAKESASTFAPVREAFWLDEAARWAEYTRRNYGGGPNYHGRGFIQNTHLAGYRSLGPKIAALWGADPSHPDFDLVANPDKLLDPDFSAAAAAIFFRDTKTIQGYGIVDACREQDWDWVRRLVYGGPDPEGATRIARIAAALSGTPAPVPAPVPGPLPFVPDVRIDVQPDDWSCSVQSMQWLLRSIGRNPSDQWLHDQLVGGGIVSPDVGLRDATGKPLAAWLTREYGAEMGFTAQAADVTFDDVLAGAGVNPTMIGGRTYGPGGHWVGVRRADEQGWLELANPAPGFTGTGTHLDRAEWDARGPWSAIYIDRAAMLGQQPAPPVEPAPVPQPTRAQVLVSEIRERLEELASLVA
jgi:hypothetical protein